MTKPHFAHIFKNADSLCAYDEHKHGISHKVIRVAGDHIQLMRYNNEYERQRFAHQSPPAYPAGQLPSVSG
nr:hypothetical protein [Paenibacillus pinihumi]